MPWSVSQQNNVMSQLINEGGLSPYGAAGLVSRWSNVEDSNGSGATVNGIGAVGIGQWLGSRQTALESFADEYGLDPTDVDTQTQFAIYEGNTTEKSAWNTLTTADDPDSAATGASMFERAEGYDPSTGTDNFTDKTANGVPTILSNYQNSGGSADDPNSPNALDAGGGGPSDQGLNADGSPDLNEPNVDAGNPESNEQVENDVSTGDYAGAASETLTTADSGVAAVTPKASTPGKDLVAAVNAATKQAAADTQALTQATASSTKSSNTLDSALVASIEAYTNTTFGRAVLVGVGALFILGGVLGLAFGGFGGVHTVLKRSLA